MIVFEALILLQKPEIEELSLWKKKKIRERKRKGTVKHSPLEKEKLLFSTNYFEIVQFPYPGVLLFSMLSSGGA